MRILTVNTTDARGGAAVIASTLHRAYRQKGIQVKMAVGTRSGEDPDVLTIPNTAKVNSDRNWLLQCGQGLQKRPNTPRTLCRLIRFAADPRLTFDLLRGIENFHFPGSWHLLDLEGWRPDVIHCHNLHGGYFDLRALPWLSRQVPVVLTLQDAWLLSGHCAHSFDCERWTAGCGKCPDLNIYPSIRRDATSFNWKRKQRIFAKSRVYVATPCRWLTRKVQESLLVPAISQLRVIPNGVDLKVFHPGAKAQARATLMLPERCDVVCFAAESLKQNVFKDYATLRKALEIIAAQRTERLLFVALGAEGATERIGEVEIRFARETSRERVAIYYQASDIYVHAAKADTLPTALIEAQACGVPAVASAVGGIPEIIEDRRTGLLVPPKDPNAMADAIVQLLGNEEMRSHFAVAAVKSMRDRFDAEAQVDAYLDFYESARKDHAAWTKSEAGMFYANRCS